MGFILLAGLVFAIFGAAIGAVIYAVLSALARRRVRPWLRALSVLISLAATLALAWAVAATDKGDSMMGAMFLLAAAPMGGGSAALFGAGIGQNARRE